MKIAVIGTGNVGSALGGSLARAGHRVTFAGRDAAKAHDVASSVGAAAVPSPEQAVSGADVVVLAVPFTAADEVASEIAGAIADKVVIDVTNPLRADFSGLATEGGPSGAERFAELLPGASVVKAFNTIFASAQGNPALHGVRLDALYATDDEHAAAVVSELAAAMGFRPIKVGQLAAARELEALAWLNIRLQATTNGDWQTAYALVHAPQAAITTPEMAASR